jgi:DNA mismatch repair protein MLH1
MPTTVFIRATFKQGIIVNRPAVCATVKGTSILIEDLFKNTPIRLKSMRPAQEYAKILECMEKYAIHYFETSFILKVNHK